MKSSKKSSKKITVVSHPDIIEEYVPVTEVTPGVIYLPPLVAKEHRDMISTFTLDKCRFLFAPFADMVMNHQLRLSPNTSYGMRTIFEEMTKTSSFEKMRKDALCSLYDSLYSELSNFLAIAKADIRYEKTWHKIITSLDVSSVDIKKELGREIRLASTYGWYYNIAVEALFSPCMAYHVQQYYSIYTRTSESKGDLTLRASVRKELAELFFGKEYVMPRLIAHLPEDAKLSIDNFEPSIPTDIMTLDGIALNGSMLNGNGSISAANVKRVRTQATLRDFSPALLQWPADRIEMLTLTFFTMNAAISKSSSINAKNLAKFAVETMPRLIQGPIFNTFLPACQSFTKAWTAENSVVQLSKMVEAIIRKASDEWLDLNNFKMLLLCSDTISNENFHYLNLFPSKGREKATIVRKIDKEHEGDSKWKVKPISWFDEIGFKFAIHWLKYLCALGIVELAVESELINLGDDPLEGMRYVRLTPLGKYAFGIEKSYTPTKADCISEVEFDSQNCIFTLDAKSPFMLFLSTITRRISPTRLRISRETLIKGCFRKEDLEQRIRNLSVIINPEKEPALKKIIDDALHHTDCAHREGGYSLLNLRSDLPELRQLILNEKELREMTIMVGNSRVLVKTNHLERFYALCASHGYLMQ
ncbi:MAG: hypothetical protein K2N35_16875 [Muribaculaceae bacterium]|nr:hypothetical protein [Muribaculaceae bacterium]